MTSESRAPVPAIARSRSLTVSGRPRRANAWRRIGSPVAGRSSRRVDTRTVTAPRTPPPARPRALPAERAAQVAQRLLALDRGVRRGRGEVARLGDALDVVEADLGPAARLRPQVVDRPVARDPVDPRLEGDRLLRLAQPAQRG